MKLSPKSQAIYAAECREVARYYSHRADRTARAVRLAGMFLVSKARQQAIEAGTYRAAVNLRKQGVPLSVALEVLT